MQFQINKEFFDLTKTINTAFDTLQYFQKLKQIKPEIIIEPAFVHLFKNIYGDEHRIGQLLINFLSNAFKMTPVGGSIKVELIVTDSDNQAFSKLPHE